MHKINRVVSVLLLAIVITNLGEFLYAQEAPKYCIVIHGGAGASYSTMPDSLQGAYHNDLQAALTIGNNTLKSGGTSVDAVEQVIRFLEDSPLFNAGKGSVLNINGIAEMDASIMNGKDLSCGAVAAVHTVKNPVSLARNVMEKTKHVLLVGYGADAFAREIGAEEKDSAYFIDPERYRGWLKIKSQKGTVGAVALDVHGNLAAATSTGGMAGKMAGRAGDSPIINCGTYANNSTCAVSCTGWGEQFIKNTVAFRVSALMEYKNLSLKDAVDTVLYKILQKNDGGVIAVDKDGNYCMEFNTSGMFRAAANSKGVFETYP
ncbi:MAG: isoaspartyl peptidase/L-asparaginase [Ignavibacteriales bacterium]|nr:isoaspartyl peptidase/L-asparaginase [Ignavibacteriales bacterium]